MTWRETMTLMFGSLQYTDELSRCGFSARFSYFYRGDDDVVDRANK